LFQSKLPKKFWSYAIVHATFIINRVTTPLLHNKSPYHLLHNHPPNLEHLKVFGSLCYASTLHIHRTKLDPRARKCIFIGYKPGVKGVILYDLHDKKIFVSRDVVHYDHILLYQESSITTPWTYHTIHSQNLGTTTDDDQNSSNIITQPPDTNSNTTDSPTNSSQLTSDSLPQVQASEHHQLW
jgi:hypothetical protein